MIRVSRAVLTSSMGELQFSWPAPPRVLPFTPRFVWIRTTAGMEADWRVLALTQANIMNSQKRSLSVSTKKACQVEVARSRVCAICLRCLLFYNIRVLARQSGGRTGDITRGGGPKWVI